MNWLTRIIGFGEKIKKNFQKKFPSKEEQKLSPWISCCGGKLVLKSTIFNDETQHTCPNCSKHYFLSPKNRFDFFSVKTIIQ